jgi:outer membrane protein
VQEARAVADAAAARSDEARAALLPVLSGSASYQRATANIAARVGTPASATAATTASGRSYDYYSAGLSLSQLLWDFGQTTDRWRASRASARAQGLTAESQRQQALLVIRTSYFAAQAARALVGVARETKGNTGRHLEQMQRRCPPINGCPGAYNNHANSKLSNVLISNRMAPGTLPAS